MTLLPSELTSELPTAAEAFQVTIRLLTAAVAGAVIGIQRERSHKTAGLRTHILVALGSAVFVVSALAHDGGADAASGATPSGDVTRIVQGIASGIGFIGAGAILKLSDRERVKGLTTAAGIWMTAAIGAAAGWGRVWLALLVAVLSWIVLSVLGRFEAAERHNIE